MPEGEIGGPDSEIFFDFGTKRKMHENSQWKNEECHPNCDCGRFLEIGNSVFIQYKKENGQLVELPQKNVDFGGGLERMAAATNNDPDVFKIDVLDNTVRRLEISLGVDYNVLVNEPPLRIIADHIRAVTFMELYGVSPSNKGQGYIMRRLLRRAALKVRSLSGKFDDPEIFTPVIERLYVEYRHDYFSDRNVLPVERMVSEELSKFMKTLEKGMKEVEKINEIDGKIAFDLYQTFGFPLELSIEIFQEKGQKINVEEFKKAFLEHQNKSRSASSGVFKGGLADHSEEVTRLHTATHLLHAALRKVLGDHVQQKGSNITSERLRFDFVHTEKVTPEQISEIETLINTEVDKNLPVNFETMTIEEADSAHALHFFDKKYEEKVKVYTVGDPQGRFFSKEVCGGPHVTHLSELHGHVKITKEEAVSAGVRRIYATIV
jgi:alanyl-tRNA synthetase